MGLLGATFVSNERGPVSQLPTGAFGVRTSLAVEQDSRSYDPIAIVFNTITIPLAF